MALETTQKIGFAIEGTAESDPINAEGALYWKFGARTKAFNDKMPTGQKNWIPTYTRTQRMPTQFSLRDKPITGLIGFYPTTTVADYLLLGACTTAATNIHTITNIDTGSLPTFTVRWELSGGTAANYQSAVGCKATALSGQLECTEGYGFLSNTLTYNAIKKITATREGATTGPVLQTAEGTIDGTSLTNRYHRNDGTFAFTFNSNDIKADLVFFNYTVVNQQQMMPIENQAETEYIDEGNYIIMFSGALLRGSAEAAAIENYYQTEVETGEIVFTIYNGSTNYATRTFTNVRLGVCDQPNTLNNTPGLFQFSGVAEDYGVVSLDGITDGVGDAVFYGE
jgi:hypothetical protein